MPNEIGFYKFYLKFPPLVGPVIGSMLVHHVAFQPLLIHTYVPDDVDWTQVAREISQHNMLPSTGVPPSGIYTSMEFNAMWWDTVMTAPVVGFLLTTALVWTVDFFSKYASSVADSYKDSCLAARISFSIRFTKECIEAVLPNSDTADDMLKFVVLSAASGVSHGVVGATVLGRIGGIDDMIDITNTQGIGAGLIPASGVTICWLYRAAAYTKDKCNAIADRKQVPLLTV